MVTERSFSMRGLRRVPLRRLVFLAVGSLMLTLVVVGAVGEMSLRSSHNLFEGAGNSAIEESKSVTRLRGLLVDARALGPLIERDDAAALTRFETLARSIRQGYSEVMGLVDDDDKDLTRMSAAHWSTSEMVVSEVWSGGGFRPAAYRGHVVEALDLMETLFSSVLAKLGESVEQLDEQTHKTEFAFLIVLLIGSGSAIFFASYFRRAINGPLKDLREAASQFSMDNLSHRVRIEREDELGDVAKAFNSMAARLLEGRQLLLHQAFHDSLTGLPNRSLFRDRAEHALIRSRRHPGTVAVIFVDLDDFKHVNDTLGHGAGDDLLLEVATRLESVTRDEDTVARLGGDEFAVLLEDLDSDSRAVFDAAERILKVLRSPVKVSGHEVVINASLGLYSSTSDLDTAEELLRRADVAMYAAKAEGKGRYREFEMSMHDAVTERARLDADLARALERDELDVMFQPVIDLRTGLPAGAEALLRWKHPSLGYIPPDRFISIAEQSGQIVPIGEMVIERTAEMAKSLANMFPGVPMKMGLNLSIRQLQDPDFIDRFNATISRVGCDPHALTLEITESMLAQDVEHTAMTLLRLKDLGVAIAVDDFGTGYSSLSYLKRFPLDILKIDKSFVDGVASGIIEESALARSIIGLAQQLGLSTVAEGIEHSEQKVRLTELGCDFGQGFYFSRAVAAEKLIESFAAQLSNSASLA